MALKCSEVELATSVCSGSELLLFVQLKTQMSRDKLRDAASYQTDIVSVNSDGRDTAADDDDDDDDSVSVANNDEAHPLPDREAVCSEVNALLKQWLPVHCKPDAVEVVDKMPSTNHGKFQSSHYWLRSFSVYQTRSI